MPALTSKVRAPSLPERGWIHMARITVEDCLEKIPNRFQLALAAVKRAKMLLRGARPLIETDNKEIVTALREIAAGEVKLKTAEN